MAYDPRRQRVLLHGGASVNPPRADTMLSDTWEWDGTSWQEVPNANGPPRAQHQMAYDEKRQLMAQNRLGAITVPERAQPTHSMLGIGLVALSGRRFRTSANARA